MIGNGNTDKARYNVRTPAKKLVLLSLIIMRKIIIFSLIALSFALGIFFSLQLQNKQSELSESIYYSNAKNLPSFNVLDQNGKQVNNQILKGRWSLMFFGFTNCPDVCPNTLSVLTEIQNQIKEPALKPQLILVSVDPMRDTAEIMKAYTQSFSEDIIGLTGELHDIQILTEALGVHYAYNALPDGSYTVDHTAAIFIINPDGKYAGIYTGTLAAKEALKVLRKDFLIITSKASKL